MVFPITALFWYSAFKYFPGHFSYLTKRFSYYVFGDENVNFVGAVMASISEWLNLVWLSVRGLPREAISTGKVEL